MKTARCDGVHGKKGRISQIKGTFRRARRSVRNSAYVFSNGALGAFNGLRKGSKRVALVSSRKWKGKEYDDLLLQRALIRAGARVEIVAFEDNSVNYSKYDRVVVRSMWGYQNELERFEEWEAQIKDAGVPIFNSLEIIERNYDKAKQIENLQGFPVIPTVVIEVGALSLEFDFEKFLDLVGKREKKIVSEFPFVVKPAISASGENTFLVKSAEDFLKKLPLFVKLNREKKLLVQSFVPEIVDGELGVVLISGKISHAVRRFPGVISGSEYKVELVSGRIDAKLKELCERIYKKYSGALYLRVDVVKREGSYTIMEVEAFEPALFFGLLRGTERKKVLDVMADEILKRTV